MGDSQPTLESLAAQISDLTAQFTKLLKDNDVEAPTFAANSPTSYSKITGDMFMTRQKLADALQDLWILSQGPSESIFNYVHCVVPDTACLHVLNHFNFWTAVPLDGSATIADIAKQISLPEEVVERVIEHALSLRFFAKVSTSPLTISHTSRSAALSRSPGLRALVAMVIGDTAVPMLTLPEALEKYSRGKPQLTTNMNETAFSLAHSGGEIWGDYKTSWDFIENDGVGESKGWRQRNFVTFMAYIKDMFNTEGIVNDAVDWAGAGNITLVDIGGSAGHDDVVLARKYPNLKIVVEDLPEVAPVFEKTIPSDVKDRVSFRIHNMFDPQPVHADIYMLKWILHDWPEEESIKILQALRPVLKPGARVIFIDYVGKQGDGEDTLPRSIKAFGTATDLRMMALFNAKERPVETWKEYFRKADERYDVVKVKADPLSFMVTLEVIWRG